ncbi:hypothetical protein, partial [Halobacteriovorax sp.]|uniref:hypothetical protein n=1 Tax=Halobacteriovorax sp. TaxID=2020862 RepID=UPI003569EF79
MFYKFCTTLITGLLLVLLTSCNAAKEVVEVKDQGRFNETPTTDPTEPSNSDISAVDSIIKINKTDLYIGEETNITFIAKDSNGVAIQEGGMTVTF